MPTSDSVGRSRRAGSRASSSHCAANTAQVTPSSVNRAIFVEFMNGSPERPDQSLSDRGTLQGAHGRSSLAIHPRSIAFRGSSLIDPLPRLTATAGEAARTPLGRA